MNRADVEWRGYWPAAPTPFRESGELDLDEWRALLRLYARVGVHGVLVNGTSGEWTSQSDDERRTMAEVAVEELGDVMPVVIGCSSLTPGATIALGRHAAEIGAAGVLATAPPYVHLGPADVIDFYTRVDDAVDAPLMVYNWPRGVGVDIDVETARRLAELDHVVAIKNSTPDFPRVLDYLQELSGSVRIFAALISRRGLAAMRELGGDGYIDGGALGAPFAVPFFEALWEGDLDTARRCADAYARVTETFVAPDFGGTFGSPQAQLKAAMALLGQPGGTVRPPFSPITEPATIEALRSALDSCELHPEPAGDAA